MNRPVSEHIRTIRQTIDQLEQDLTALHDPMEALKTETDLRSLRLALMHYELALQIEREVIGARQSRGASGLKAV